MRAFSRLVLGGASGAAGWTLYTSHTSESHSSEAQFSRARDSGAPHVEAVPSVATRATVTSHPLLLPLVFAKEKFAGEGAAADEAVDAGIKEYWTGFTFPFRLTGREGLVAKDHTKEAHLSKDSKEVEVVHGTGKEEIVGGPAMRCMLGACHVPRARAYSFALYLDLNDPSLHALRNCSPQSPNFFDLFVNSAVPKTLVLKMARSVDAGHIARGFERALTKSVLKHYDLKDQKKLNAVPSVQSVKAISSALSGKVERGDEVVFSITGSKVAMTLNGREVARVEDRFVARAILEMYLGEKPVSREGKRTISKALALEVKKRM